ncbi:hypothetical protein F5X96DRAFT_668394 [Biscogniauxia mediterranea]|nr:hypothetical protein F5X96DRAFT_668394 [Biscogniauxia mediterranea]
MPPKSASKASAPRAGAVSSLGRVWVVFESLMGRKRAPTTSVPRERPPPPTNVPNLAVDALGVRAQFDAWNAARMPVELRKRKAPAPAPEPPARKQTKTTKAAPKAAPKAKEPAKGKTAKSADANGASKPVKPAKPVAPGAPTPTSKPLTRQAALKQSVRQAKTSATS